MVWPDRFLHQLGRGQQVIIEILFDNADAGAGERDGFGADLRGDVGEFLFGASGGQRHPARVLHQALAVLIDGDRDIALRAGLAGNGDAGRRRGLGEQRSGERASQSE